MVCVTLRAVEMSDNNTSGVAMVLMAICPCSMVARLRHGDYR